MKLKFAQIRKTLGFPLLLFALTLFISLVFFLCVNVVITRDMYDKAETAIASYIETRAELFVIDKIDFDIHEWGEEPAETAETIEAEALAELDSMDTLEAYIPVGNSEIVVTEINLSLLAYDNPYYFYAFEEDLIRYIQTPACADCVDGVVYNTEINGDRIFFATIEQDDFCLLYVNTGEYLYTLDTLNDVFILLSVVLSFLALVCGYVVGRRLDAKEAQLKRFFSNASHELKTPLTSIQGYAESIYLDVTPDPKHSANIVMQQCKVMEKLIEELLLLSKIESRALQVQFEEVNLYEVLDRLLSYHRPRAQQKEVGLSCVFQGEEVIIACDERYIDQALGAVLSNAIRYAKHQVTVSICQTQKEIVLCIQDDGAGIAPQDLPHIFERFYIGEHGGTGIGLSLAKEIIRLHGGNITADNHPNATGAVFQISFPRISQTRR